MQSRQETKLFSHPFSKDYWKTAAGELKNTKTLIFAALMIALRVVFKQFSIPLAADLRINTTFLVNATGAMVMGPVLAALCAAVTDTLGAVLFPTGPYFFPFIFVEMASSVLFALFFYRARVTVRRIIASRFFIDFLVNIVLQTPIMMLYYEMILGKYYAPLDLMRIIKNIALFPLESLLLVLLFRYLIPVLHRMGYCVSSEENLRLSRTNLVLLAATAVCGILCIGGYAWFHYDHTSLSAAYTADERFSMNDRMTAAYLERHPEESYEDTLAVIESAYPKAFDPKITYTLAIYHYAGAEDADSLRGLSKSKAAAEETLIRTANVVLEENRDTGEILSWNEESAQ